MNIKTYAIIRLEDIGLIDFSQVAETSSRTVRKNLDNSKFVIKWQEGQEPTFIANGKVTPLQVLTHAECLEKMATSEWSEAIEEKEEKK
tara:strand:+ start:691 stop:957 length:267 start_codon:yes stop_codon:yes gene_type:complete